MHGNGARAKSSLPPSPSPFALPFPFASSLSSREIIGDATARTAGRDADPPRESELKNREGDAKTIHSEIISLSLSHVRDWIALVVSLQIY